MDIQVYSRQEKRAMQRQIEKKRSQWSVKDWKPMMQIHQDKDPNSQEGILSVYTNYKYTACVRRMKDGITHISFRNSDNSTDIPWSHKQQIKNDICGREREAIEIFPAMSRLVDAANQYHLWVYPEGHIIPIGFPQTRKIRR